MSRQYTASIKVLLGDAAAAAVMTPIDTPVFGLEAIGAADHTITPAGVETYELSARQVAEVALLDSQARSKVMSCVPSGLTDSGCYQQIAEQFGRLAWRRTLEADEVDGLVAVALGAAAEYEDGEQGVGAMVSAVLQSPDFLYQVEIGDANPEVPGKRLLRPTELASRMSFFILGQTPTAELLDLADGGGLEDEDSIREAATVMLERPEATAALRNFYSEIFDLRHLAELQKDPDQFPQFTDATREAIAQETLIFLDDVVWTRNADAREIFDANYSFVNKDNAWIYGVSSSSESFQKMQIPGRVGILSQPSFLAKKAHAKLTSPTRRGLFVLTSFLCHPIPPPPPDVDPTFPPDDGTPKTMRMRLQAHAAGSCQNCHEQTDSIGLALEHFDAVGAWRDKDQGLPIDTADQLNGFGEFEGVEGVAARLRENDDSPLCMARSIFRQSMGHIETKGEEPALDALDEAFASGGYTVQGLLVEIASSPAFRLVGEPK